MKKIFSSVFSSVKKGANRFSSTMKVAALVAVASALGVTDAAAQSLAGTGYEAGTSALEDVATELTKYIPYVVNLCYALAGIVAVLGAISVYIAIIST